MKRIIVMLLCLFAATMTLTACSNTRPKEMRIKGYPRQFFYVGSTEQEFKDSLAGGSVIIRRQDNTTTAEIPLNDPSLEVTGFSSQTPGNRHITVKHKSYSNIEVRYTIEILKEAPASFKISVNPTVLTYSGDVTVDDIDLDGGKIIITTNYDNVQPAVDMTADNCKVVGLNAYSKEGVSYAQVVVQLVGTNLVEKFEITITQE